MNPEDDDREPIEVLYDIEEKVESTPGDRGPLAEVEPRMNVKTGTKRHALLQYISENGPVSLEDCRGTVDDRVTGTLTDLWNGFLVDRFGVKGEYTYKTTPIGERALSDGQQPLSGGSPSTRERGAVDPWTKAGISKSEYHALRALRDTEGHPTTKEMDGLFREYSGAQEQTDTSYAVTPRMSTLYKSGYVDRTPSRPYVYWLTDKGKEVLND